MREKTSLSRRQFIGGAASAALVAGMSASLPLPAWARGTAMPGYVDDKGIKNIAPQNLYNLGIGYHPIQIHGRKGKATGINGTVPGPLIKLKEGERVKLNVTNNLMDSDHSSIHWHGILLPFPMDGVPGVNFAGIKPGETFEYEYDVVQGGTYWYHSHSAFQEQTGAYGPLIIEPKDPEPISYDRDYVVVLSDWSFENPHTIFRNITLQEGYYNYQQRTLGEFFKDVKEKGFSETLDNRLMWSKMRMSPVDLAGVTGATYTYLMNGHGPADNWTGIFNPGETIRLRVINAAAMTNFDFRIPGLNMDVVMVDGKFVKPVNVHEFRIGVAETIDVLVTPKQDKPFTLFAESLDRSGYTRGTLSPEGGLSAAVPPLRPRPVRKMKDIGMMAAMDMKSGEMRMMMDHADMAATAMPDGMKHHKDMMHNPNVPGPNGPEPFKPDRKSASTVMIITDPQDRLQEPGIGLGEDGWKVLTYKDLVSNEPQPYKAEVDREMTINITANMERYMFSFDGKKFSEHPGPYLFNHNERLRLYLVNHTMMEHPIHLHGMWMHLENGKSHDQIPYKHTILVKPGEKLSALVTPIEKGDWAFHCHLLYHMEAGMFQVVRVA
ncbi:MAG: copper resistance protein CopA [Micavibrio sp.]|nr:copper resistance protein CopA [Micavibrio sp.]|tara:strand:+ start:259885 stop:261702 length:1818 start_codon:yes stop_codon:yes gene_type:complete